MRPTFLTSTRLISNSHPFLSLLYLRALANAGSAATITQVKIMLGYSLQLLTEESQLHCEELFEPARVLAVKLTKVRFCARTFSRVMRFRSM
jgi:hypothetical protein